MSFCLAKSRKPPAVAIASITVIGLVSVSGMGGLILAVVGAVPLLAGVFDVCLFAPLFGGPLKGAVARAKSN